jgi:transcription termination factor Rho
MNLTELKKKPIGELIKIAEFMGLEGMARNRKQDIIFAILKRHAMNGEEILVMVFSKFFQMVLAFYALLLVHI